MNFKNLSFLVSLSFVFLLLTSCGKENIEEAKKPIPCAEFSTTEIASVGITHNDFLTSVWTNFDCDAPDHNQELINQFYAVSKNEYNLSSQEVADMIEVASSSTTFNIANYSSSFTNYPVVSSLYKNLFDAIYNSSNLNALNSALDCISVTRNSGYHWSPTITGGAGTPFSPCDRAQGRFWGEIIAADAAGAASAFMTYGAGLAVPGTNAAIAGIIAISAGMGSAYAAAAAG